MPKNLQYFFVLLTSSKLDEIEKNNPSGKFRGKSSGVSEKLEIARRELIKWFEQNNEEETKMKIDEFFKSQE